MPGWTAAQSAEFETGIRIAGVALTVAAGALVGVGIARGRRGARGAAPASLDSPRLEQT